MRRLIVAIALLTVACSGGDVSSDNTETTTSSKTSPTTTSTTTTTSSTTTTTTVSAPIPIFPTTNFSAGTTYEGILAGGLRYQLMFLEDGWEVEVIGQELQEFIHFINTSFERASAEVGLVLFMANQSTSAVSSFFLDHENIAETTQPTQAEVAGFPAQTLDVRVEPGPSGGAGPNSPCLQRVGLTSDRVQNGTVWVEEVLGCTWTRIWIVDLDGITVTIYGSRWFEELAPVTTAQLDPAAPFSTTSSTPAPSPPPRPHPTVDRAQLRSLIS